MEREQGVCAEPGRTATDSAGKNKPKSISLRILKKSEKPRIESLDVPSLPSEKAEKHKRRTPPVKHVVLLRKEPQDVPADTAEELSAEQAIEVDWRPVEESTGQDEPSSSFSDKFRELVEKILPEDRYQMLSFQLLSYLNKCLENGTEPDWDYIMRDGEEGLLPVHRGYKIYLLEHLLEDKYIEGFSIEINPESSEKSVRLPANIQITPQGKKYVKENSGMGKVAALLRSIKDCIPGI